MICVGRGGKGRKDSVRRGRVTAEDGLPEEMAASRGTGPLLSQTIAAGGLLSEGRTDGVSN